VHIVLLDNGRTNVLRDELGRQALRCIRCAACLNVCPVYERAGGHAYGATYPGPIGAILTPQLVGVEHASTLPFASSLCGYCAEVCPVKIDIPSILVKLRHDSVRAKRHRAQDAAFAAAGAALGAATREVRAASLLAFMVSLPIAFLSLVPSGSVSPTLFDVIQVLTGLFPFKPALHAMERALDASGPSMGTALIHLAILTAAYGLLARFALRRFTAV
jgi:L-lactate utilization protein LutB